MSDAKTVLTPEQIAELRAALEKATPGPWEVYPTGKGGAYLCEKTHHAVGDPEAPDTRIAELGETDARLVALMKSALPSLLDAAERCARLSESIGLKFNGESVAVPAIDIIENVAVQLASAIARAEAAEKADLAAVRGACALALRWLGDPDDPNGTFEDIGAWYQRETGRLRPGKSLPMAMAGDSQEEREKHFRAWADAKDREVRAALRCARVDTYLDDMQDSLTTAIARAEAAEEERDRMRPVVESAVAEYRAADAANDETEPDDTQVQRNGRWAKAETTLHIAVHNYLGNDHAKGGG